MKPLSILAWLSLVMVGFSSLAFYAHQPGKVLTKNSLSWPADSKLSLDQNRPTLLVFLHPQCSCSRATLSELERLMVSLKEKARVYAVFKQPKEKNIVWTKDSFLWNQAIKIPGVIAVVDENGTESNLFGALTSGQSFFYQSTGQLIFSGGLTPSRGHQGDSRGREAILTYFTDASVVSQSQVFGCALNEGSFQGAMKE